VIGGTVSGALRFFQYPLTGTHKDYYVHSGLKEFNY